MSVNSVNNRLYYYLMIDIFSYFVYTCYEFLGWRVIGVTQECMY